MSSKDPQNISIQGGWTHWSQCTHMPSDNYEPRPSGADGQVSLLVIHCVSLPQGCYGNDNVRQLFCNQLDTNLHTSFKKLRDSKGKLLRVSSHLFIARDGNTTQFVSLDEQAWHAGKSCYRGTHNCNAFSIGIELEGTVCDVYTSAQYQSLVILTRAIRESYPHIGRADIVGHSDVAIGRKEDPGALFDWGHYLNLL